MPLYAFTCPAGHVTDKRVTSYDVEVISCACGEAASRAQVNRVGFSGFAATPMGQHDFRDDYRRFREASEGLDDQVSYVERETNTKYNSPLFTAAKAYAADLQAKGVTADTL